MRNRAIFASDTTKSNAVKRAKGGERTTRGHEPIQNTQKAGTPTPEDTMKDTTKGAHDHTHSHHISKICLDFAVCCLRNSRG